MGESNRKFEPLGATEFAATLNGENPSAIHQVLLRFAKQVRKERLVALSLMSCSGDDGDEYSSSDDVDDEEEEDNRNTELNPPPSKKFKKAESWKEDTSSYHVPFVGTAVSRGDVAEVIKGEWPTGLLKAYLRKSPLAIELTGDDWIPSSSSTIHKSLLRRKQTKLSRAIYKAYLKCLAELVTASVPLESFQDGVPDQSLTGDDGRDGGDTDEFSRQHPFLSALLKLRLKGIFNVLIEETDKGHGKPGIYGGCGKLAPVALQILQNVARTSIGNARLVCRFLDEELMDGVLKVLLRPPPPPREVDKSVDDTTTQGKRTPSTKKPARVMAIRLASTLLKTGDSAVAAYVCTAGNRERKIKPGIVYHAFRDGLARHSQTHGLKELDDSDYFDAVLGLLQTGRKLLGNPKMQKSLNSKQWNDLFARDPLSHLCDLSDYAPILHNHDFIRDVLAGADVYLDLSKDDVLSQAAIESRRLLYLLMADRIQSPVLGKLPSQGTHPVLYAMLRLFQSRSGGMRPREFLVYCTQKSPLLLPELLRVIPIPDPGKHFAFISTLRFLNVLMKDGPSPHDCLVGDNEILAKAETSAIDLLSTSWPLKLKRQALARALQSGNPLVILETVKFLNVSISRFIALEDLIPGSFSSASVQNSVRSEFISLLPDLQLILAVRSKQDIRSHSAEGAMVSCTLNILLEQYAEIFPEEVGESSFDWMKLLPEWHDFSRAPCFVQRNLLRCLGRIISLCSRYSNNHVNSVGCVLEIMLQTKDDVVHDRCLEIARILLAPVLEGRSNGPESIEYTRVELDCWLDALTIETLPFFCEIVATARVRSIVVLGEIASAVTKYLAAGHLNCSILMMTAFADSRREVPFAMMVIKVATRVLLFQRDPIPFADFILSVQRLKGDATVLSTAQGSFLVQYSKQLVEFRQSQNEAVGCLERLLSATLGPQHTFLKLLVNAKDSSEEIKPKTAPAAPCDILAFARFYVHIGVVSGFAFEKVPGQSLLRQMFPALISSCSTYAKLLASQTIEDLRALRESDIISDLDALLVSCSGTDHSSPFSEAHANNNGLKDRKYREKYLSLPLLYDSPTRRDVLSVQLSLLQEHSNDKAVAAIAGLALGCSVESAPSAPSTSSNRYDFGLLGVLFRKWWSFSQNSPLGDELCPRLEAYLSDVVANILSSETMESTYLLVLFSRKGEDRAISRCTDLDRLSGNSQVLEARGRVLEALLKIDPARFAPPFLARFSESSFLDLPIWKQGILDPAVLGLVEFLGQHQEGEASMTSIVDATISRVTSAVTFDDQVTMKQNLQADEFDRGALDLANQFIEEGFESTVTREFVHATYKALRAIIELGYSRGNHVGEICRLGRSILETNDQQGVQHGELCRELRSTLLIVMSERLLWANKREPRVLGSIDRSEAIDSLITLFDSGGHFDTQVFTLANRSLFQKLFRSALKHGIHDGTTVEMFDLSAGLLTLVQTLLTRLERDEAFRCFAREAIEPSDVFQMVTSHSKFEAMLLRGRSAETKENDLVALVLLMHTCIELSPVSIAVESQVWKSLWSASTAGLNTLDKAVYQFGILCSTRAGGSAPLPFLDESRCLGGDHGPSRENRRWDWLLDGLETSRIQETISFFPVDDCITPKGADGGERESSDQMIDGDTKDHIEPDTGFTDSSSRLGESYTSARDYVRDKRVHERYSPALLLPLLLGALHYCTVNEDERGTGNKEGHNGTTKALDSSSPLSAMAKRMCDKSVPGLCLASLASRCEEIRGFSVCILGLLLSACNTEEARAMSSWRERPQIVMLLSSVQRALVLEREKQECTAAVVPILPTLVSTFLARASLSISKPDDAMYVPLNRYFLKSDTEHGAFQDMSRLPAFIALYCSAGDDPAQSRKERIWALNHVRDGFLDSSSYRLVVSCHAPELLLTSFENIRLSSFSDEMKTVEYVLLLDTIKTLLVVGGRKAAVHLVGKIGLSSWLCSLCTSHSVTDTFPMDAVRIKILELIDAVMDAVQRNTNLLRSTVIDEACQLLLPVVQLSCVSNSDKRSLAPVFEAALRSLGSIYKACHQWSAAEGTKLPAEHSSGLNLPSAMKFLRNVPVELLHDAISSICSLPYSMEANEGSLESAADFCSFVLEWHASAPNPKRGELSGKILRRIVNICSHFGGNMGKKGNTAMARSLLSSTSRYHRRAEDGGLWLQSMELLHVHLGEGTLESELASDVLGHARLLVA